MDVVNQASAADLLESHETLKTCSLAPMRILRRFDEVLNED